MARSLAVPHVPSSSVKVAVPSDVMARIDTMAENAGLSRDDCVELGFELCSTVKGHPLPWCGVDIPPGMCRRRGT